MTDDPARNAARERPVSPHEACEFRNSVEYTVQITFVVAGGARWRTAYRRARKVVERLANTAARAKGVVDVQAVAGPSHDGELVNPERVSFEAANAGHATNADPARLDRYLDPDYERALASLAEANAAARVRQQADRSRREAVGCANPSQLPLSLARPCGCVYCRPGAHLPDRLEASGSGHGRGERCLCGRDPRRQASACTTHRRHALAVLDGDPPALVRLAAIHRGLDAAYPGDAPPAAPEPPELPGPGL